MKERTFISFDWAIKKVLRHKDNFGVLEGFLSELLGFDLTIQNRLESESNQQSEKDKFNRVDILVKSNKGELMLIEVQYDSLDEWVYFLKNSEIKDSFKAKGMKEAKVALNYQNMPADDKSAYKRFIEDRRNAMSTLDTALEKGIRQGQIKTAKALLELHIDTNSISIATQLTFDEIDRLSKGEDIDKESDEDD
jgi:hypothetical protein